MRKWLSVWLVLVLLFTALSLDTFGFRSRAASGEGLSYTIANGEVTITDCDTSVSGELVIPNTIEGYPVTKIGKYAFSHCCNIMSVVIPAGVTSIDYGVFLCKNASWGDPNEVCMGPHLQDVYYGGTKEDRGAMTIHHENTNLLNATWHYEQTEAMPMSSRLTYRIENESAVVTGFTEEPYGELVIPGTFDGYPVTAIDDCAFRDCEYLTSVIIPSGVTTIGDYAFCCCYNITDITIPKSLTRIGERVMWCDDLPLEPEYEIRLSDIWYDGTERDRAAIEMGDENWAISGATWHCAGLSYRISNGEVVITNCDTLAGQQVMIPSVMEGYPVTAIGELAFYNCRNLASLTLPSSVTRVDHSAFVDCDSLTDVYYTGSQNDRNDMSIGDGNAYFVAATWHYNTCAEEHIYSGECDSVCNRCDWTREQAGVHTYNTACDADCNICGMVRVPEIHKVRPRTSSFVLENDAIYPFSLKDGIYTSTNKTDNSFSRMLLKVTENGSIVIEYATSTESGRDTLLINHNATNKVAASGYGVQDWETVTIPVVKGDVVSITYQKDQSTSRGNDEVYVKVSDGLIPAQDVAPTCKEPVVCAVCGLIVKEKLPHSYDSACDTACNICREIRHVDVAHTYDNACDTTCNVCGFKREITLVKNGWMLDGGNWYFYKNGTMLKNTWQLDSVGWCYLGSDGAMKTNAWIKDSVGWCYVGADGYCVTNKWLKDSVGWMYLDADGRMVTNSWVQDSVGWCYLGSDGTMKTNSWIRDSVGWCYVGADGYCLTDTWARDSVGWVYLNKDGRMLTNAWVQDSVGWCYVGADGYAVTNCWKKDSIGWCYLNTNGSMTKNEWVPDGGKWYYCDANGYMVTGTKVIGGKTYKFGANGVWVG